MAHYAKHLCFLLLMVLALALHIEARESKFFTKVIRDSSNSTNTNAIKSEAPLLAPAQELAPALAPTPLKSEYGYGLYGHESSEFPPTKTTTTTTTTTIADVENEIPTEELSSTESYKEYNTGDAYNNNNNYYYNNNNGYSTSSNNINNNGYTNSYNNNNGYVTEKKGMSDTRYLENGKYYYNVKSENYYGNGYESVKESGNNERYYGNSENNYEFNTMEEYERQQGYPQSQEGYVP
uniref:Protein E6-like n=1 Tax=Davidia involucrata TaxID=16924 RepID=A0A5B7AP09_DAVIN